MPTPPADDIPTPPVDDIPTPPADDIPTPPADDMSPPQDDIPPADDKLSTDGLISSEAKDITDDNKIETPLEEKVPVFSKMFYVSFNGVVTTDKTKKSIAKQVSINMHEVCQLKNKERLNVYRVRIGPRTVSVEIGIEESEGDELTSTQIKDNLVQSIVDKQFIGKMIVIELDTVKDIYFDGISKYDSLSNYPSQFKRVLVEMDGDYPESENNRVDFEDKLLKDIKEFLEDPELDINRIQLENITNIVDKEHRVFIQFVIMNGLYEKKSPHEILMKFKENYSKNDSDNDFTKKYKISNVVFGEPSVILDNEDLDKMKSLAEEKTETETIDKSTYESLETDYKRMAYFGCDRAIDDIKNNMITSSTPLSPECEDDINKLIRGF